MVYALKIINHRIIFKILSMSVNNLDDFFPFRLVFGSLRVFNLSSQIRLLHHHFIILLLFGEVCQKYVKC